jgi:outer membrane protein, heavy metal efflux system
MARWILRIDTGGKRMKIKDIAPLGVALVLALYGCATEGHAAQRRPPEKEAQYRAPSEPPGAPMTAAEEPRGPLSLREVLRLTLLRNPELAAFASERRAAEARTLQAGVLPNPALTAELENVGGTGATTRGVRSAEATIQLSQLIELGGKRAKRLRLAGLEQELTGWDYEAKRLDVLTEATKAFVEVLAADEGRALATELLRLAEQVQRTAAERVKAGKVSPVEEVRARAATASARLTVEHARHASHAARKRLAASWGSTTPVFERLSGSLSPIAPVPSAEALEALLQKNPDIARWAAEMEARRAEVAVARSKAVPDLTVSGGVRYFQDTEETAFVVGVSLPLLFFDRNQGGIREAHARLAKAEHARRAAEVRVLTALSDAYQRLTATAHGVAVFRNEVLPAAEQAFHATQEGYRQGKFGFLEVVDAQRSFFETRGQYLEALATYHKAVAEIERVSGAGLLAIPAQDTPNREGEKQ